MTTHPLKAGCLAYLDTLVNGLVPVKVTAVTSTPDKLLAYPILDASVVVTATRGAYKQGDELVFPARSVVPRGAVRTTSLGQFRIGPYDIAVTQ